jgi:dolichyl-phosphate beta-glucosyltransferase
MNTGREMVSIVLACFDEIEHLAQSYEKIRDFCDYCFCEDYEIVFVDDGSTDGTREWLSKLASPQVRVHLNEKNLGRGGAVKKGLEMSRGSIVGFMDVDCEMSEVYLARFAMAISRGADLAVGRRIYNVSMHPYVLLRQFLSLGYKALVARVHRLRIRDSEAGYKFFSRRLADHIVAESRFDDWFWDSEVCLLAEANGLAIVEVTGAFVRNRLKVSTVHVVRDSVGYLRALARYRRLVAQGAYKKLAVTGATPAGSSASEIL